MDNIIKEIDEMPGGKNDYKWNKNLYIINIEIN